LHIILLMATYNRVRQILSELNLEKYLENFINAEICDSALPHLNDQSLKEVNIPVGSRLIILATIKKCM